MLPTDANRTRTQAATLTLAALLLAAPPLAAGADPPKATPPATAAASVLVTPATARHLGLPVRVSLKPNWPDRYFTVSLAVDKAGPFQRLTGTELRFKNQDFLRVPVQMQSDPKAWSLRLNLTPEEADEATVLLHCATPAGPADYEVSVGDYGPPGGLYAVPPISLDKQGGPSPAVSAPDVPPAPTPGPVVPLTDDDNGRQVAVSPGQTVVVTLRDPGDGGYFWYVLSSPKDNALTMLPYHHNDPPKGSMLGNFGQDVFRFTLKEGEDTRLRLLSVRPWAPNLWDTGLWQVELVSVPAAPPASVPRPKTP